MPARLPTSTDDPVVFLQPVVMPGNLVQPSKIDSMTAFEGALYVSFAPADGQAAAIWLLDPVTGIWEPVLQQTIMPETSRRRQIIPPMLQPGFPDNSLPGHHAGFVGMAVFQGADDASPCLYVTTQNLTGAQLLRSVDGRAFETVLSLPVSGGYVGLTGLAVWNDRLVMTSAAHLLNAPTGAMNGGNGLPRNCVLASRAPAQADQWEVLSEVGFGDPENLSITALTTHRGKLYAGTANPVAGFQIWSRDAESGTGSPGWTCVMRKGATRHGMNPQVALLASHHGYLWIGSAMDEPELADLDWPAAELLRLDPDDSWQLIAGETRLTPQGLRRPLSRLGPGLEDPGATRLGAMAVIPEGPLTGGLVLGAGPLAGLWISRDGETWKPLDPDEVDEDDEAMGGVTGLVAADGRLWIAMDDKLFSLEQTA